MCVFAPCSACQPGFGFNGIFNGNWSYPGGWNDIGHWSFPDGWNNFGNWSFPGDWSEFGNWSFPGGWDNFGNWSYTGGWNGNGSWGWQGNWTQGGYWGGVRSSPHLPSMRQLHDLLQPLLMRSSCATHPAFTLCGIWALCVRCEPSFIQDLCQSLEFLKNASSGMRPSCSDQASKGLLLRQPDTHPLSGAPTGDGGWYDYGNNGSWGDQGGWHRPARPPPPPPRALAPGETSCSVVSSVGPGPYDGYGDPRIPQQGPRQQYICPGGAGNSSRAWRQLCKVLRAVESTRN